MQEHPIPQDVTGYKFHIVGNMTLKQFAEVGAGVLIAVILYNTNLLFFIKWPLIILSAGLGAMMAFVPIEERPLDHWIMTFFRRLYSPTKFYWRKETEVPFALKPEKLQKQATEQPFEVDLTPARQQRIREYIESVKQPTSAEPWEAEENSRVSEILGTFNDVQVKSVQPVPKAVKPQLTPRIRALPRNKKTAAQQVVFESPAENTEDVKIQGVERKERLQPQQLAVEPPAPPVSSAPAQPTDLAAQPVEVFHEEPAEQNTYAHPTTEATTNDKLPFPQKDTAPNLIMGMVLTPDNKLVDRAVVTIKNTNGDVIMALKTNLLGQFFATAALPNGSYNISAKKDGFSFPDRALTLNGAPVTPVELRAA